MPAPVSKAKAAVAGRPTETLTGIGLAAAVYGFLTQAGVSQPLAAIIAIVIAFVPVAISNVVDAIRGSR